MDSGSNLRNEQADGDGQLVDRAEASSQRERRDFGDVHRHERRVETC